MSILIRSVINMRAEIYKNDKSSQVTVIKGGKFNQKVSYFP